MATPGSTRDTDRTGTSNEPAGRASRRPLAHRLAAAGSRFLGVGGPQGGRPQPVGVDRRGARRLLGVDAVLGVRAVHGPRVRGRRRRQVPAHLHRGAGRRGAAGALHVRGGAVRRAQLDDHLGAAAPDPDGGGRVPAAARHTVRHVRGARGAGRPGRRQLRVLDGQHQHVLPRGEEGPRAGPQRRRRQHRRGGRCSCSACSSSRRPVRAARSCCSRSTSRSSCSCRSTRR